MNWKWVLLIIFGLLLNIFNCIVPIASADEVGQGTTVHKVGMTLNETWTFFLGHLNFTFWAHTTGQWYQLYHNLNISFRNVSVDTRKFSMHFNTTEGVVRADYRINMTIQLQIDSGTYKFYSNNHTFLVNYSGFRLWFNFTDIFNIQGLIFNHGKQQSTGWFWFTIEKDALPKGYHYDLDPFYTIKSTGVSTSTNYPGGRKIVRLINGTLVCAYLNLVGGLSQVYLSRSLNGGSTWKVTKVLTNYVTYNAQAVAICVNSTDTVYVIWGNQTGASAARLMFVSYNDSVNTTSSLSFNCSGILRKGMVRASSIAIDNSNNVHVAWKQAGNGSTTPMNTIYRKRSGTTWISPKIMDTSDSSATTCPNVLVDNSNNVFVFYDTQVSSSDKRIRVRTYWNGNSTWGVSKKISDFSHSNLNSYPSSAMFRNGSIFLVWNGNNTGSSLQQIKYTFSTDGGSGWRAPKNITNCLVAGTSQDTPTISIDNGSTQTIHICWSGDTVGLSLGKLRYVNSTTFGTSWSSPVVNLTGASTGMKSPCMIWSWWPKVSGLRTNIALKGYTLVWTNSTTVMYRYSDDLTWQLVTNAAPAFSGEDPLNASIVTGGPPFCSVYVWDRDNGSSMHICFWENSSGTMVKKYSTDTHLNGTYGFLWTGPMVENRKYYWKVAANDGAFNSSAWFYFVVVDIPPYISNEQPTNGSGNRYPLTRQTWTNITVAEQSGSSMSVVWLSNATREFISHPNGPGNHTSLTAYGAASNYECVDDTNQIRYAAAGFPGWYFSNNGSDYVAPNLFFKWRWDTYAMQDHTTENFTIYNVSVYLVLYFGDDGMGSHDAANFTIKTNGTFYNTTVVPNGYFQWTEYRKDYPVNPFDGRRWTWLAIDRLACGVCFRDNTGLGGGCSAVYIKVNPKEDGLHQYGYYRQYGLNASVTNSTRRWNNSNFTNWDTTYYWRVIVSDAYGSSTSQLYHFTTKHLRMWMQTMVGQFFFSNTALWRSIITGYFVFSNIALWRSIISGYFVFQNTASWQSVIGGYYVFFNGAAWHSIESGWFIFGNIVTGMSVALLLLMTGTSYMYLLLMGLIVGTSFLFLFMDKRKKKRNTQ